MEDASLSRRELIRILGGLGLTVAAADVLSQDATKVDPRAYKVMVDNDQVRVLEYIGKPRLGVWVASHPNCCVSPSHAVRFRVALRKGPRGAQYADLQSARARNRHAFAKRCAGHQERRHSRRLDSENMFGRAVA